MYLLVLLVAVAAAIEPEAEEELWESWKTKYGKNYPSEDDENVRRMAWLENADFVEAHNSQPDVTFFMEMNNYADELSISLGVPDEVGPAMVSAPDLSAPPTLDWRDRGVISPVKNQGMTGSVEAFVAAECVESYHAIHTGTLFDLSAAEVWECCSESVEFPVMDDVFGCIHNIGGLCTKDTYKTTGSCGNATCSAVAQVTGTKHVPSKDEGALQTALLKEPIWVTVNASPQSFLMYKSGIYKDPSCVGGDLDHVMQLVGYGVDGSNHYWICKNSWGSNWGMSGYILIERGTNRCGIAELAKYPY